MTHWNGENYETGEFLGCVQTLSAVEAAEFFVYGHQQQNTVIRVRADREGARWYYFACYERSGARLRSKAEADEALKHFRGKKR